MKIKRSIAVLFFVAAISGASAQVQWVLDTVISTGFATTGIDVTPDDSKIVISNNTSPGMVKIISTSGYSITSINISSVGNYPTGVTIAPNGSVALVTTTNKVAYIDLSTNTLSANFAAPCVATTLYKIGINASSSAAYMGDLNANCINGGLRTFDATGLSSGSTMLPVNTGYLYGMGISGNNAIVTTYNAAPLNINLSSSSIQTITGMSKSYGIALFNMSNEALVYDGDSIARVSLTSNSVTKKIAKLSFNTSYDNIAITADDKYAFIMGYFEKLVIALTTNSVIQTFSSGGVNVATLSDGSRFFVTDASNGTVRVYKKTSGAGVGEVESKPSGVIIYPNPATDHFKVSSKEKIHSLQLFTITGDKVIEKNIDAPGTEIEVAVNELPEGIYFIRFISAGNISTSKLIVQH